MHQGEFVWALMDAWWMAVCCCGVGFERLKAALRCRAQVYLQCSGPLLPPTRVHMRRPSGIRATPRCSAPSATWGPTAPLCTPPTPRRLLVGLEVHVAAAQLEGTWRRCLPHQTTCNFVPFFLQHLLIVPANLRSVAAALRHQARRVHLTAACGRCDSFGAAEGGGACLTGTAGSSGGN